MDNIWPITFLSFIAASIAAWFTHVISTLMAGKYLLLLVGALIPPIGVIHGFGLWIGIGW